MATRLHVRFGRLRFPVSGRLGVRRFVVGMAGVLLLAPASLAAGPLAPDEIPPPTSPIDPAALQAARALAQVQRDLDRGDYASAQFSLARARGADLLTDYVSLFEARMLLVTGHPGKAVEAARRGREAHAGTPVAVAFSELLGEALLAKGDEAGARAAWQVAYQATHSPDRRALLEERILASHERTGTLSLALQQSGSDTAVADGSRLPAGMARDLRTDLSADEWLERADQAMEDGHSEDAIAAYDAALAAGLDEKATRHARRERGHALFRIRRYDEALTAFGTLLPEPEARFWYARSLARAGRVNEAVRSFETIGGARDARYGTWSLYLAGTLLEDNGQTERAMALYEQVARQDPTERGLDALWRVGWSAYGHEKYQHAREVFVELAKRSEPIDALRPRYWAARAAEGLGKRGEAKRELRAIALEYPFSYYGWRAGERLGKESLASQASGDAGTRRLPSGPSQIDPREVERVELLLEADLRDFAAEELGTIVDRARGLDDRKALGRLYVRTGDYHRAQRLVVDAYRDSLSRGIQPGNESLWWLSWPPAYREVVTDVFPRDAVIDPALVWAIMREESGYRPWVTSSAGARGLLQIMPTTGAQLAQKKGYTDFEPDDLYTPRVNIDLGAAYLDELGRRFPGRLSAAIGSYNAGPTAVNGWLQGSEKDRDDDAWVEDIPYHQTRAYVKRVLRSLHVYRTMYPPAALLPPTAPARVAREG